MREGKCGSLYLGIRDYTLREDGLLRDEWDDVVPIDEEGYVKICPRGGSAKRVKIAELVAKMFVPKRSPGKQLVYLDGNEMNWHADNLWWSNLPSLVRKLEEEEKEYGKKSKVRRGK